MEVLGIILTAIIGSGLVFTLLLQLRKLLKGVVEKTENKFDDALLELLSEEDMKKLSTLIETEAVKLLKKKSPTGTKEEDKK